MKLTLFNTKTRTKEPFVPADDGVVRIYVCGPTVYDRLHLGHARSYVLYDALKRVLRRMGLRVLHAQNFTDVEESISRRADEEGVGIGAIADRFIESFFDDMDALFVERADAYPRVTEHIDDILAIIADLEKQNVAYEVDCGARGCDVYFDVSKALDFGSLIGQRLEDIVADRPEKGDRRSPADFALWKSTNDWGTMWPSPWGAGRPGWHVECTAMAVKHLGPTIDIHGGGLDLVFPHHESEQAIGETWTKKPYVRYFVHNGFVTLNETKMSKSLGNVVRVNELLAKHDAEALRALLLSVPYRQTLSYSEEEIHLWEARVGKWRARAEVLKHARGGGAESDLADVVALAIKRFDAALGNDLDFGEATRVGEELLRRASQAAEVEARDGDLELAREALRGFGRALGYPSWGRV